MGVGIGDISQACLECGKECKNRRSLGNHVARAHKNLDGLRGYLLKHHLDGQVPRCKCGCGEPVKWHKSQYRFNDYLTGHNPAGFKVKQPTFTQSQIDARNAAIRAAYADKGDEIKSKISVGVAAAMKARIDNGHDFSEYFRDKWQDPDFQDAQHAARLESWRGEAGEERRAKVFTSEFGRKISFANIKRDNKRTSKLEKKWADHLRTIWPGLETSKWFNFSEKIWCADIWIPSERFLIEIDGVYWHGLDRDSDWSLAQIKSMANDLIKNRIAREDGLSLIRIRGDSSLSGITDLESLLALGHHVVIQGKVLREGSPTLRDNQALVSRDSLLMSDRKWREDELLPALSEFFDEHVKYHGWFYPPEKCGLDSALLSLRGAQSWDDRRSSVWLKSRSRAFWEVDGGPMKSFQDGQQRDAVLRYRLGLNNSRLYDYKLADGTQITDHETFDISLLNIRRGFVSRRSSVSWFKPAAAQKIWRHYLGACTSPVVWDPSIGFGARLLGFAAAYPDGRYIGTDPAVPMIRDAKALARMLQSALPRFEIELHRIGSEEFHVQDESVDLVFTSPPYFDREKYFNEESQCWYRYPQREEWIENYLLPTLKRAHQALKSGGTCVLNINGALRDVVITTARRAGFDYTGDNDMTLPLRRDHFARKRNGAPAAGEPVLALQKG